MFENIEKIEKELYAPAAYFKLKNVVMFGSKNNSTGSRMDAVYAKNYPSAKYSNYSTLNTLSVRTSDYLVLSYTMKDAFTEIYVSYPHIKRLVDGFKEMAEMLYTADLFIERDNALYINGDFQHINVKIPNLVGGKSIVMVPDVVNDKHNGDVAGVLLYIGKESNAVQIEFEAFESLAYFLEQFNLLQSSQLLANMALGYVVQSGGVTSAPTPSNKGGGGDSRPNIRSRKILNSSSDSKKDLFESDSNEGSNDGESDGEDLKSKAQNLFDDEPVAETDVFDDAPAPKKAPPKAKVKSKAAAKTSGSKKSGKLGAAALLSAIDQEEGIDFSDIPDLPGDDETPF